MWIYACVRKCNYFLYTANGVSIALIWSSDFAYVLSGNSLLLVEARNKCLSTHEEAVTDLIASIKSVTGDSEYHKLLLKFPNITRPNNIEREGAKHDIVHHISTTPGPPVYCCPRRLAPNRLRSANIEFYLMLQQGIIRSSKIP